MDWKCIICGDNDWKNVDEHRVKPMGMSICNGCGFITYPEKLSKFDFKKHYEDDYRKHPTYGNVVTGRNKIYYHEAFLTELVRMWKDEKKVPKIFEVGAAMGMVLDWFKHVFPGAEVKGSELTKTFVNVAKHRYNVTLGDDFDDQPHDLIMSYKVAEHQPDPVEELRRYYNSLDENGYLYIGVPCWFQKATNFGVGGFDIEYYWHPDHINAWRREHFEYLLKKVGFKIVKENHVYYDSAYLCKKTEPAEDLEPPKFSVEETEKEMATMKKAWSFAEAGEWSKALETYPKYPMAWKGHYSLNRAKLDQQGLEVIEKEIIDKALDVLPDDGIVLELAMEIYFAYGQLDKALEICDRMLTYVAPKNASSLQWIANIYEQIFERKKEEWARDKAIETLKALIMLHPVQEPRATDQLLRLQSKKPVQIPVAEVGAAKVG